MQYVDATLELVIEREGPSYKIHAKSVFGEREGSFELPSLSSKIFHVEHERLQINRIPWGIYYDFGYYLYLGANHWWFLLSGNGGECIG